jgi:ligand-binding SRPBCC domain-containing protein
MPVVEHVTELRCPPAVVFEFLSHPANLLKVSPPDMHLKLIAAPERVAVGVRVTVRARRWGISRSITNEVTALEPETLMIDEQREGPFGRFVHTHRMEPTPAGTRLTDRVEFEPPGGFLGLILTAARVERELREMFEFRDRRFRELLEESAGT